MSSPDHLYLILKNSDSENALSSLCLHFKPRQNSVHKFNQSLGRKISNISINLWLNIYLFLLTPNPQLSLLIAPQWIVKLRNFRNCVCFSDPFRFKSADLIFFETKSIDHERHRKVLDKNTLCKSIQSRRASLSNWQGCFSWQFPCLFTWRRTFFSLEALS